MRAIILWLKQPLQQVLTLACMVLLLAATDAQAEHFVVEVRHGAFTPAELTISVGDTVEFFSVHDMTGGHKLIAADNAFESPSLGKDERWLHTFTESGTYSYHLQEHTQVTGKIIVR